jgi:pantetheine-phosphate adenylyltransferase
VLTPNYLSEKKNWVEASRRFPAYQTLTGHREFAIPLVLKDCEFPPFLRPLKCVDFRNPMNYQSNLDQFVSILKDAAIDNDTLMSSILLGAVSPENRTQEHIVTIGGTFDTFHKGHKDYIGLAFQSMETDCVLIYVTSDEYVRRKKDHIVQSYERRVERLKDFIQERGYRKRYDIRCLHNEEELEFDYLENDCLRHNICMAIVPPEYYDAFLKLNQAREARGLNSFLILVKMRTRDHRNEDLSSSLIRYHSTEK